MEVEEALTFGILSNLLFHIGLLGACAYAVFWVWRSRAPFIKRDMTAEEVREYDGKRGKRILIIINRKVFDVSRNRQLYGPDGPYGIFAGRDASRGLGTGLAAVRKDGYDDLSDLTPWEMWSVRSLEMQFMMNYTYVGKLIKPALVEEPEEGGDDTIASDTHEVVCDEEPAESRLLQSLIRSNNLFDNLLELEARLRQDEDAQSALTNEALATLLDDLAFIRVAIRMVLEDIRHVRQEQRSSKCYQDRLQSRRSCS